MLTTQWKFMFNEILCETIWASLAFIFGRMAWSVMRISVMPRLRVTSQTASASVMIVFSVAALLST